jgi:hypothetical protein
VIAQTVGMNNVVNAAVIAGMSKALFPIGTGPSCMLDALESNPERRTPAATGLTSDDLSGAALPEVAFSGERLTERIVCSGGTIFLVFCRTPCA